jgi:uncharacterized protein (DUF4415 family)
MKQSSKTDWDRIDAMTDDDIDYSDSPEMTEEFFKLAFIRKPHHKKPVSLRLDDDIISFFKKTNKKYQTKINDVLRAYKIAYENTHR